MSTFDLSAVQAVNNEVLPPGTYSARVCGIEIKDSKSGGKYVQVEFAITTQGSLNRRVWDNFNIKNDNKKAVEIGMSKLKSLALAAGFTPAQLAKFDPTMLAAKEVMITTKVKSDEQYGDKAEVKNYAALKTAPTENILSDRAETEDVVPF